MITVLNLLCQSGRNEREPDRRYFASDARIVNVLITTRNRIIKSFFIKRVQLLPTLIILYVYPVKFYWRPLLKIELFIFTVQ